MTDMGELPPDLEKLFKELGEQEGGIRPVTLPEAYLRALQEIEELPCNQSGQDKSWVLRVERRERSIIKNSRLVN
jgi:hypothetical protein